MLTSLTQSMLSQGNKYCVIFSVQIEFLFNYVNVINTSTFVLNLFRMGLTGLKQLKHK